MSTPGFNTLLMGGTGTGKTYSLRTLLDSGIEVFVLATEPGISSTLGDTDKERMHWQYIAPANPGLDALKLSAQKINQMSFEGLAGIKSGINKDKYGQFVDVVSALQNFTCDRTGKSYGSVDDWGPDRAIVVDSLTGLNIMALDLVTGAKPVKAQGEWGVAIDNLERLITFLCTGTNAHFILTAHQEREQDEVTGGVQIYASALGRKLGPKLPRFFDDVISARREEDRWFWSTVQTNVDLKARNLAWSDKLQPNFGQILEAWKKKGGVLPAAQAAS